jgi:N-acetylmuramoyl-L-alanine amidase
MTASQSPLRWIRSWFLVLPLVVATTGHAAPLALPDGGLLTHPRPEDGQARPVLAETRTLFVNGHLAQATAIRAEGKTLRLTEDRRFADLVPWPADRVLDLELLGPGGPWRFTLALDAPAASGVADPAPATDPGWTAPARVRLDGGPLSTIPGGSYWMFPQAGVEWVADRREGGWLRLPLTPDLAAWVPEERATRLGGAGVADPALRRLGPAVDTRRLENGDLELVLPLDGDGPPLWREEGDGGSDWRLILPRTRGRLDWVELDPAGGLEQLDWEPLPGDELQLRARLAPGSFQGHSLRWEPGRLVLTFHRRAPRLQDALILLDPGHGGRESGCIGASGTQEKDLALLVARELRDELEKAGARVLLTRDSDSTLSLGARVARARELRADLLLSLHYNSVGPGEDPWKADGHMVFSWSPWSARPAGLLHQELRGRLPMRDKGLHWRSLGICRHHGCPALLLEVGSLAHPDEEARLLDPHFRKRQLKAIRRGLEAWFREAPDPRRRAGARP